MKFLLMTLISHLPDPISQEKKSAADRLREVIDAAVEDVPSLVELRWRPGEHQAAFT